MQNLVQQKSYKYAGQSNKNDCKILTEYQSCQQWRVQKIFEGVPSVYFFFVNAENTFILGIPGAYSPEKNFAKLFSNIRNFSAFWNHFKVNF